MYSNKRLYLVFLFIVFTTAGTYAGAAPSLTLQEAETLALEMDPGSKRFQSLARSMQERSVADGQLPDPKFRFGLMNFPVDTFNRDQEPMTQIQFGMQQQFPRGDSLDIKTQRTLVDAKAHEYRAQNRQQMLKKQVRLNWLELYYWLRAEEVVSENRKLFEQLLEVTQFHYGSGRRNQQDVIRAQLELSRLDDRLIDIKTRQEKGQAELAVLTGRQSGSFSLPDELPVLAEDFDYEQLQAQLYLHPSLLIEKSQVEIDQQNVALAREAYKPGWMLGVNYGFRDGQNPNGSDRADFFSVGVTVDVPLFKEKRQDRRLKSRQYKLGASKQKQDLQYLELKQMLDKEYTDWKRLQQRHLFYHDTLIPQARQNSEAALFAYQNDRTDFTALMRARITELDTHLKSIRINVNRVKAQARVLYIAGEQ
jgi:outer membrane protein TolC